MDELHNACDCEIIIVQSWLRAVADGYCSGYSPGTRQQSSVLPNGRKRSIQHRDQKDGSPDGKLPSGHRYVIIINVSNIANLSQ